MHTCNCVSDNTVSSTSSDPVYFAGLIKKLTKSEEVIDDSLYKFVKAKVYVTDILELLESARQSRSGLTPQVQTELSRLIALVNNTGLIPLIESIEDLAEKLKDRMEA